MNPQAGIRHVITLNAGSSSIKFALFELDGGEPVALAIGLAEMLDATRRIKVSNAAGAAIHQEEWQKGSGVAFHT